MKKKKLIPCIIAIVAIVLLGIAGVKLYQLMFGGAVKVQTADIISAIAQMKLQLIHRGSHSHCRNCYPYHRTPEER